MLRHFALFVVLGLVTACGGGGSTGGSPVAVALRFITEPSGAAAGVQISPTVRVAAVDDDGGVVAGYSGVITLALIAGAPGVELTGTATAAPVAGIASFPTAAVNLAGSGFHLVATASGLQSATSVAFAIAGPHLAFAGIPVGAPVGEALTGVEVEARDAQGQLVADFSGEITVALFSQVAGAVLGGTATLSAVGGRATFTDLSVSKPALEYRLVAATAGFGGATSAAFAVTLPPATTLAFSPGPAATMAGHRFPVITIEARDSRGERAISYGGTITLALAASPGGGALLGTTTAAALAGVATFPDLRITLPGSGYILEASASPQLQPATSDPVDVGPLALVQLSVGEAHTCGVSTAGTGFCWGMGFSGEIGDGQRTSRSVPTAVRSDIVWRKIEASFNTSCGLSTAGAVYCWGLSPVDGSPLNTPQLVSGTMVFDSLSVGGHLCGLTNTGTAYCWGSNGWGQLGDGTMIPRSTPTPVAGGRTFNSISAGTEYTCGVTTAGAAYCWGLNSSGQVGDGTSDQRLVPAAVAGGLTFRVVRAGSFHTCGITTDGAAYCWSGSGAAYLGGSNLGASPPVPVTGGLVFTDIDVGTTHTAGAERHTCAVVTGGSVYCWGESGDGNLGDGTARPFVRESPGPVSGSHTYSAITAGANSATPSVPRHTCALTTSGAAMCWGSNNNGQLGDGTSTLRTTPTAVVGSIP
jgi:alpha-tubulin suppressor-like RCC1 family protein